MLVEVHRARVLLRELDSAAAMLELARIAHDFETVRRNYTLARKSYEVAVALFTLLTLGGEQAQDISNRLVQISGWLDALDSRFQSN